MKNKDKFMSEVVDELPPKKSTNSNKDWGVGRIFWGILLVIIGGLILADNLSLIEVNWGDAWRLWPLIIIASGISILSLNNNIWRIISVISVVIMLGIVIWVMVGDYSDLQVLKSSETSIRKISNNVTKADINIKAGAISLDIGTANQDAIVKSKFESNISKITETSVFSGETQQISLVMSTDRAAKWWMGNMKSVWNVYLTQDIPLTLAVDAGASDANIDVAFAKLESADIKIGVSSLTLRLGDIQDVTDIYIESGVSSILIKVPSESGVRLKMEDGLTSKQIADLTNMGNNIYESNGYSQSKKKINITGKVGVSSFTIERY